MIFSLQFKKFIMILVSRSLSLFSRTFQQSLSINLSSRRVTKMSNANMAGDTTTIHFKEGQEGNVVIPAGYQPQQITIIKHEAEPAPPIKPTPSKPPETVAEMLQMEDLSIEVSARLKFIRKVYLIVGVMLWVTIGFCFISYYSHNFFMFQLQNPWCFYMFLGIAMALTIIVMVCGNEWIDECGQWLKLTLMIIIVLSFSYIVSYCTSLYARTYGAPLVVQAAVLTWLLVFALTLYAFVVKTDFSTCFAIIMVVIVCFVIFGISFAFTMSGTLHTLFAVFGCIIAGIILVIDTQWIADGDRGCSLDDPLLGALILYIDIIRVFLYVLQAMGSKARG